MSLTFNKEFMPDYGNGIKVAENIIRLTVNNPGAFTGFGTNSYIIGNKVLAIIDPGPEDEAHLQALLNIIDGRPVSHIFVSHTHRDHSPLTARLKELTGAISVAQGPHQPARSLYLNEVNQLDASNDTEFKPDIIAADGDIIESPEWAIEVIHTPGHTANHACFALRDSGVLFSADHVMAWATSIVAPPDGSMADYMHSLEKLLARKDKIYYPGHGGPVTQPAKFLRGLRAHRKMRERAVLERVLQGDGTIQKMVEVIYRDTDKRLHGAAALSVLAHLEDLISRNIVTADGPPTAETNYRVV